MRLETLLPRPLDPCGGSECATLMGALIAAIHLDRRRARALGWRGRPPVAAARMDLPRGRAGSCSGWSSGEDADGGALRGTFAAYAFPSLTTPFLRFFRWKPCALPWTPATATHRALGAAKHSPHSGSARFRCGPPSTAPGCP
ncbi:MAG: hypothetical protein ACLT2T_10225 [Bilophila wadsworthia]